jgi:hypothetical protein
MVRLRKNCQIREIEDEGKTNFDQYLVEQLKDEGFTERFKKEGEAWDVALELAALRKESGLSQKELAGGRA